MALLWRASATSKGPFHCSPNHSSSACLLHLTASAFLPHPKSHAAAHIQRTTPCSCARQCCCPHRTSHAPAAAAVACSPNQSAHVAMLSGVCAPSMKNVRRPPPFPPPPDTPVPAFTALAGATTSPAAVPAAPPSMAMMASWCCPDASPTSSTTWLRPGHSTAARPRAYSSGSFP